MRSPRLFLALLAVPLLASVSGADEDWRDRLKRSEGGRGDRRTGERYTTSTPAPGGCRGVNPAGLSDPEFDSCIDLLASQAKQVNPWFMNKRQGGEKIDQIHNRYHTQNQPHGDGGLIPLTAEDFNKFKDEVALPYLTWKRDSYRLNKNPPADPDERARQFLEMERRGIELDQASRRLSEDKSELGELTAIAREEIMKDERPPRPDRPGGGAAPSGGYQPRFPYGESEGVEDLRDGYDELAAGDPAAARAAASKALAADSTLTDALRLRAQAAALQRDYAAAAADAKAALARNPNDEKMQGLYALMEGRGGGAGGLDSSASAGQASSMLGQGAASLGSLGGSTLAESAADAANNSLLRQARERMKLGDYAEAEGIASKALGINPNDANALYLRALARGSRGDLEGALQDAVAAAAANPNDPKYHATKAAILNKLGRYGEAQRAALEALERDPRDVNALRALAHARAGLGDREGMLAALRQAAELNPQMQGLYVQAMQAPEDADLLLLFSDQLGGAGSAKRPASSSGGRSRRGLLFAASLAGGALLGLGLLRFLLPPLRSAFTSRKSAVVGVSTPYGAGLDEAPSLLKGQFRIVKQIGAGGMGVVFEGEDVSLGRRVAIKRMRDELKMDRRERERFVSEAKLVAALRHPNIVEIYSIVEENSDLLLVFEYVAGRTLHEVVQSKGRLTVEEALPILRGVADALDYAHHRAIIHRDLKPSNIMLDEEGKPRVMDFGIARAAKDAMTRQAMTNTVVGTPPYMAPEQEQGLVRKESDVYALAICVYEMLTGRLAFAGTGAGMLMNKLNKTFAPVTTLAPELPAAFDDVFAKAFDPDPNKRYATGKELLAALEGAAARRA